MNSDTPKRDTLNSDALRRIFRQPGNEYRLMPLLRINDEVDPAEIDWQIRSLKEQGFGGVFACCEVFNNGSPHKLLSDGWWRTVDLIASICAREGLEFWVYDDEDWPSGSAGGQLPDAHPEYRWKYLHPIEHAVAGGQETEIPLGDEPFVAAVACRAQSGAIDPETIADLSAAAREALAQGRKHLTWTAPAETGWTVTIYTAPPGKGIFLDGYCDLMDRQAVATFIDWVYQGHWDRVDRLGSGARIRGYFTDEPAMSFSMVEWPGRFNWFPAMPFTPELPEAFRQRHGYDWTANLPLLYHDAGPASLRFRCHHWETCSHLYSENYFGQIHRFCEAHGAQSSGHLVIEENFAHHLAQQGGNLPAHYRHMHIPGVDWINPFGSFKDWPATTPKYATSVAHLMGRPRTWCESFAGSGWGLTFQQMRRIVGWEHANGINMVVPISYKYSLRGPDRTRFYPPGISYQQPYWEHLRGFADAEARLCVLASGPGHVAQVALAYPSVDIWAHCWEPALLTERGNEYNRLGDLIRSAGYDFDILDDQALVEEAEVIDGQLQTASEAFEVIVMPRQDAVRRATLERCLAFVCAGGKVIFIGALPRHSFEEGGDDPQVAELLDELLGKKGVALAESGQRCWREHGHGQAGFAPTPEEAVALLREACVPDLILPAWTSGLVAWRRRLEDAELYLLFNHQDEPRTVELTLSIQGYPERWRPETGTIEGIGDYEITSAGTRLRLAFQAQELIPIVLYEEQDQVTPGPVWRTLKEVPIEGPFQLHIEETMTRPHVAWNFTQREDGWTSLAKPPNPPAEIPPGDWTRHGLDFFSGLGHYRKSVMMDEFPAGARVVLDLGRVAVSAEVRVNGRTAGLVYYEPYQLDITDLVQPGVNDLEVIVANTLANYFAQFEELRDKPLSEGGDTPERRMSGLLGPVKWCVMQAVGQDGQPLAVQSVTVAVQEP